MKAIAESGRKLDVLVVDDHPWNRTLVRRFLRDINIHEADHPGQALERDSLGKMDMIVTDYKMPHMDGASFVKELRRRGYGMPIIGMSTCPSNEGTFLNAGASAFLEKDGSLITYTTLRVIAETELYEKLKRETSF
ncbi:MAG TPA: response regulator [Candidatus Nanoarchaeia archaeon]|nr:response regulator [Candidatus Nanoarchaeia archaeon]